MLEVLFTIQGIGAASGLLYHNEQLFVISDNSNYLYNFQRDTQQLDKKLLIEDSVHTRIPKDKKADLEAITQFNETLYLFGSGSTEKRNLLVTYTLAEEQVERIDLTETYHSLQTKYGVAPGDFNIEGALAMNDEFWLFNRGNGPRQKNGIFVISRSFTPKAYYPIELPKLHQVPLGFTDATLIDGKIYFIAAAEDSRSNYLDGEVKGTVWGVIDPRTKALESLQTISETHKFEGMTCYKESKNKLDFLLCEDQDGDLDSSNIYQLTIFR